MILREWLETRTPAPPPRLLQRIVEVLGPDAAAEASSDALVGAAASPDTLVDATTRAIERLGAIVE